MEPPARDGGARLEQGPGAARGRQRALDAKQVGLAALAERKLDRAAGLELGPEAPGPDFARRLADADEEDDPRRPGLATRPAVQYR